MIKELLTSLGLWLARLGYFPSQALVDRARVLCLAQNYKLDISGEYKRHQVYAQLIKEYPHEDRKKISLAIELALCT